VPSPTLQGGDNALYSIAAATAHDIWAVGSIGYSTTRRPLVEHWNGMRWLAVSGLAPSAHVAGLSTVAAMSSHDVWVMGTAASGGGSALQAIAEHWDGAHWNLVPTANPNYCNWFTRPAAVSASDVWAVGFDYDQSYNQQTLIEHWNGTAWSVVAAPNNGAELRTAASVSSSDVWAVGTTLAGTTLTERWNGSAWSVVPSPNVGSDFNSLEGVFALTTGELWAVGTYDNGDASGSHALILHARKG
jgi:hypothetical protein